MKVLTFSRYYPKGHRREGDATFFMEKILCGIGVTMKTLPPHLNGIINDFQMILEPGEHKYTTVRSGNNWKPGDQFSARVWSGAPRRSKQIEFAQLEVKKVWEFMLSDGHVFVAGWNIGPLHKDNKDLQVITANDGLTIEDFISWFSMHPKKKQKEFYGQIICWADQIKYG